jgi:N-methylhydantoinase A
MGIWVGIDVGGTFTDFVAHNDETGSSVTFKRPSHPANPAHAMAVGLRTMMERYSIEPQAITQVAHGTTVATNALIQRTGARVALVTTKGFRDVLEIGRQRRPKDFNMHLDFPPPVVPRIRRFELDERVRADGSVEVPLRETEVDRIIDLIRGSEAEAVAVCLLFGYLNPEHERRVGAALAARLPGVFVSLSSDVQPEFREYERSSTTSQNAYLQPVMQGYLDNLRRQVGEELPDADLVISQSSGGLMSVEQASRFPIRTALSGPAAGVLGAVEVARLAQRPHVITFDMGGTSADVAMIRDLAPAQSYEKLVGGLPLRLPSIDISTIGAGGGSIAWFDRDGRLKVGPASAGADPGPACYGQGGTQATVTDANLLLGRLSPAGLLGGTMHLEKDAAARALTPIAQQLGVSVCHAAHGVLEIVVANMTRIVRAISVDRGYDPRELSLLAFGGAGPLHASAVAASLEMREVIVPPAPGILCAAGLNVADLREDFVRTTRVDVHAGSDVKPIERAIGELHAAAETWFSQERLHPGLRYVRGTLDMHYVGQNFELPILLEGGTNGSAPVLPPAAKLLDAFFKAHERTYGYFSPDDPVRILNCRLSAGGRRQSRRDERSKGACGTSAGPLAHRDVWFGPDRPTLTPVFERESLATGQMIKGPAVIDQMDATTLVFPGDTLRVGEYGNLLLEIAR